MQTHQRDVARRNALLTVSEKASAEVMKTTVVLCGVETDSACTALTVGNAL